MMKSFWLFTIITSPLILYIRTGILIHFVWIHLIRASAKPTLGWSKAIFLFHWILYRYQQLSSAHKEQFVVEWNGFPYPCQYLDLISTFARPVPELCMITNTVLDWIYNVHGFRLTSWKRSPLTNCFGFVDGAVRPAGRLGEKQRIAYNGHKRVYSLKFQSVALPNGLIANLYGPIAGWRHDEGMLKDSGLLNTLERIIYSPRGDVLCLYGDPAYPLCPHLMAPTDWEGLCIDSEHGSI